MQSRIGMSVSELTCRTRLTAAESVRYARASRMQLSFSTFGAPFSASYWWWYGTATEGAAARV